MARSRALLTFAAIGVWCVTGWGAGTTFGGKPLSEWVGLLRADEENAAIEAALAIAAFGPDAAPAAAELTRTLAAGSAFVRAAGACALGAIGPRAAEAVPALIQALRDADPMVRAYAAGALGGIGPAAIGAEGVLRQRCADEDQDVRLQAVWALRRIGSRDPAAAMVEPHLDGKSLSRWASELRSPRFMERIDAVQSIAAMGPAAAAEAMAHLAGALRDEHPVVRVAAIRAFGSMGARALPAIPAIVRALEDEDPGVRTYAAATLGMIGPKAGIAAHRLTASAGDTDADVRAAAGWARTRIPPRPTPSRDAATSRQASAESARPPRSAGPPARAAAEAPEAPVAVKRPAAVPEPPQAPAARPAGGAKVADWMAFAGHPFPSVRQKAVQALGVLGPDARDAIPVLEKAVADDNTAVAQVAGLALERVRDAPPPASQPPTEPLRDTRTRAPDGFRGLTFTSVLKPAEGIRERALRAGESFSGSITVRLSRDGKISGSMTLTCLLAAQHERERDKSYVVSGPFEGTFRVQYNGHQAFEAHGQGTETWDTPSFYQGSVRENSGTAARDVNVFFGMIWKNGPVWEGKPLKGRGHCAGFAFVFECPPGEDPASAPVGVVEAEDAPEPARRDPAAASARPSSPAHEAAKPERQDALSKLWESLWDDLEELDAEYSRDESWLIRMSREFGEAQRAKAQARCKLRIMHDAARNIQRRIDALQRMLSPTEGAPSDDLLEDAFRAAMEDDAQLPDTRSPRTGLTMRQALQQQVVRLQAEMAAIREEQGRLIKEVVERFTHLADELELKGRRSKWEDIKAEALASSQYVGDRAPLVELELLLAAGEKDRFRQAARALIAGGKFVEQVRLMEAMHFADTDDGRAALKAIHLTLQHNPDNEEARKMLERLDVGYLMAIERKTVGEAAAISQRCWNRLSQHGEEGFWGYVKDVFTTGAPESMMAIAGMRRHEHLAELSGTVQEEAARQQIGLVLLCRFREAGLTFDQIKSLDNARFIAAVRQSFPDYRGALPDPTVSRLREAMHLALQNPDVKRLSGRSDQPLDVDTGRAYDDTGILDLSLLQQLGELICDGVNVKNVLIMVGPSAVVQAGGKAAGAGYWGFSGASAPKNLITAKEAFASAIGLQNAVESMGRTALGERLIGEFASYHKATGLIGHRAADALVQIYAVKAAGAVGRGAAGLLGGTRETQENLGRAAELFAEAITAFGVGDYDVMAKAASQYQFRKAQADAIAGVLKGMAEHAEQTAALHRRYMGQLDSTLEELTSGARLSPATQQAVARSMEEIKGELASLARKLATEEAHPSALQRYQSLRAVYEGLEAAHGSMPNRARNWQSFAREVGEEVKARTQTLIRQHEACREAGNSLVQAGKTVRPGAGPAGGVQPLRQIDWHPDFRKPGVVRAADDLLLGRKYDGAIRGYEDALAIYDGLGLGGTQAAKEISAKLDYARRALRGAQDLDLARLGPKVNQGVTDPITLAELNRVKQAALDPNAGLRFEKVGKGLSEPYFVVEEALENGQRVTRKLYVFKPDDARFPLGGEAEEVLPEFARDLGVKAPAARRATVLLEGREVRGTFVRFAAGQDLFDCDLGRRLALKKEIAKDWALRAFFGDYDGHALNYRLAADGELLPIDRNLSNVREDNLRTLFDALGGATELSEDAATRALQVKEIMKHRLEIMWKANRPIYNAMVPVGNQMTYEDVAESIRTIQTWTRTDMQRKIGTRFGADTKRVLDVLEMRRDIIQDAFQEFLRTTPAAAPVPGGVSVRPHRALPVQRPAALAA